MSQKRSHNDYLKTRDGKYDHPTQESKLKRQKREQSVSTASEGSQLLAETEAPPRSAVADVFRTYELVELILLALPLPDPQETTIKAATQVNKFIRDVAEKSKPLLEYVAGYLSPGHNILWKRKDGKIVVNPGPMNIHMALSPHLGLSPLILNKRLIRPRRPGTIYPILDLNKKDEHNAYCTRTAFQSFWCVSVPRSHGRLVIESSTYAEDLDSFLTEPPATQVRVNIKIDHDEEDELEEAGCTFGVRARVRFADVTVLRAKGVRLRDIVEEVEKLGRKWSKQLKDSGARIWIGTGKTVLVPREVFDFVKDKGVLRSPHRRH